MDKDDVSVILQALRLRIFAAQKIVTDASLSVVRRDLTTMATHVNNLVAVLIEEAWPTAELRSSLSEFCAALDECVIACSPLALHGGDIEGLRMALEQIVGAADAIITSLAPATPAAC